MSAFLKSFTVLKDVIHERQDINEKGKQDLHNMDSSTIENAVAQNQDVYIDIGNYRLVLNLGEDWKISSSSIIEKKNIATWVLEAPDAIQNFIIIMKNDKAKSYFFTNDNKLDQYVKQTLKKNIEFFHVKELQFNLLKHEFVPKHERITTKSEFDQVLASHSITSPLKLPLIHVSDPAARFIGAREGEIIKITRTPQNVAEHVFYRYCIAHS